jgi:hypothetical protein
MAEDTYETYESEPTPATSEPAEYTSGTDESEPTPATPKTAEPEKPLKKKWFTPDKEKMKERLRKMKNVGADASRVGGRIATKAIKTLGYLLINMSLKFFLKIVLGIMIVIYLLPHLDKLTGLIDFLTKPIGFTFGHGIMNLISIITKVFIISSLLFWLFVWGGTEREKKLEFYKKYVLRLWIIFTAIILVFGGIQANINTPENEQGNIFTNFFGGGGSLSKFMEKLGELPECKFGFDAECVKQKKDMVEATTSAKSEYAISFTNNKNHYYEDSLDSDTLDGMLYTIRTTNNIELISLKCYQTPRPHHFYETEINHSREALPGQNNILTIRTNEIQDKNIFCGNLKDLVLDFNDEQNYVDIEIKAVFKFKINTAITQKYPIINYPQLINLNLDKLNPEIQYPKSSLTEFYSPYLDETQTRTIVPDLPITIRTSEQAIKGVFPIIINNNRTTNETLVFTITQSSSPQVFGKLVSGEIMDVKDKVQIINPIIEILGRPGITKFEFGTEPGYEFSLRLNKGPNPIDTNQILSSSDIEINMDLVFEREDKFKIRVFKQPDPVIG